MGSRPASAGLYLCELVPQPSFGAIPAFWVTNEDVTDEARGIRCQLVLPDLTHPAKRTLSWIRKVAFP